MTLATHKYPLLNYNPLHPDITIYSLRKPRGTAPTDPPYLTLMQQEGTSYVNTCTRHFLRDDWPRSNFYHHHNNNKKIISIRWMQMRRSEIERKFRFPGAILSPIWEFFHSRTMGEGESGQKKRKDSILKWKREFSDEEKRASRDRFETDLYNRNDGCGAIILLIQFHLFGAWSL